MKINRLINLKVAIFSFIFWIVLNITGISNIYINNTFNFKLSMIKILNLVFLYIIFVKIYKLYIERKMLDGKIRLKYFFICFSILFLFLIIVWPGTWSWDDIMILQNVSHLDLTPWQHFFSGLFYATCLETIPIPGAVIFFQIFFISLLQSTILSKINSIFENKQKRYLMIILFIVFYLPPILLYALSGFRMGLYSFFELYLLIQMLYLYKKKNVISLKYMLEIGFFTLIVACWRTEGIYYILIMPIYLFLFCRNRINKKFALASSVIVIFFSLLIMKLNNYMIGNNNYSLTSTINPASILVKSASENDEELIKKIDKVLNTKYIIENQNMNGEEYFWSGYVVKNFSNQEYKEYLKSFIVLALRYPDKIIKSMWNIFIEGGSGLGSSSKQTTRNMLYGSGTADKLFEENSVTFNEWEKVPSNFKFPVFSNIRYKIILFLGGIDSNRNINLIHIIFWNYLVPICLLIFSIAISIVKKDWFKVFLFLVIVCRIPILFIASPAPYFMYYLSIYLCGFFFFPLLIYELVNKKEIKINTDKTCIWNQILQFLIVSGIGWLIDFCLYTILTSFFEFKVIFANIISSIPAITYVFLMSNKKIFKNNNSKLSIKIKYIIYFGYQLILIIMVSSFGELLFNLLKDTITIAFLSKNIKLLIKILITPITMTLNFIVMKSLIEKI